MSYLTPRNGAALPERVIRMAKESAKKISVDIDMGGW
jgi:hypothetical protein